MKECFKNISDGNYECYMAIFHKHQHSNYLQPIHVYQKNENLHLQSHPRPSSPLSPLGPSPKARNIPVALPWHDVVFLPKLPSTNRRRIRMSLGGSYEDHLPRVEMEVSLEFGISVSEEVWGYGVDQFHLFDFVLL